MSPDPAARRTELYSLLGDLPERNRPLSAETVRVEACAGYVVEHLILDLNGLELVPACFLKPEGLASPAPAILYNHWHNSSCRELIERPAPLGPYAPQFAQRGWCALCIDTWAFGERKGRTESEIFKEMLWHGQVMWGMMVYDSLRALDYLGSRPEVDASRLGTMGLSMGSTMAWWVAALDTRIRACVDLCCLTDYQALLEARGLDGHGIYYYVPRLLQHFTTAQINALIAPRAHLSLAGIYDPLTPPSGLDRVDAELQEVYAAAGVPEAWKLVRYGCGHLETAAMRTETLRWFEQWL